MSATTTRQEVIDLLKSLQTGDPAPFAVVNPGQYVQHNLAIADGVDGIGGVVRSVPVGTFKVETVRAFQDGDYVFAHTAYDFFGPKIAFDVFRFEAGRIVEHWDNLQETPAEPNPSGRTMIDGPTRAADLDQTDANKTVVRAFVDDILVHGRLDRLTTYIDEDHYHQHNPAIADGLSGLAAALEAMAKVGVTMTYDRVHRVLGEGNFVLTMSEGRFGGRHVAFYDLFRVQDGKMVEHWDTIETIPPRAEWKNTNGKF